MWDRIAREKLKSSGGSASIEGYGEEAGSGQAGGEGRNTLGEFVYFCVLYVLFGWLFFFMFYCLFCFFLFFGAWLFVTMECWNIVSVFFFV